MEVRVLSDRSWRTNAVSYTAGVVALVALCVSIWQGYVGYRHNLFSVRPLLVPSLAFLDANEEPGLYLNNRGPGPAIIRTTEIRSKTKSFGSMTYEHWNEFRRAHGLFDEVRMSTNTVRRGDVLGSKQELYLIGLTKDWSRDYLQRIDDVLTNTLVIEICYCSLYDECWELTYDQELLSTRPTECANS